MKPKRVLNCARLVELGGLALLGWGIQKRIFSNQFVRALNYHDTPHSSVNTFREQLAFYKRNFCSVDLHTLSDFLRGKHTFEKPGLILSFDDGLRSHYEVATPLLEEYGFTGWFFVSPGLIREDRECGKFSEGRVDNYMTWAEIRDLDKRHVVCCHTFTHRRLKKTLSVGDLEMEIVYAKQIMEKKLGHPVSIFGWVGGEEDSYSYEAAQIIRKAGYEYSFLTNNLLITQTTNPFHLQRTNIESDWPLYLVRFYLSGLMDIVYTAKRRRVDRRIKVIS